MKINGKRITLTLTFVALAGLITWACNGDIFSTASSYKYKPMPRIDIRPAEPSAEEKLAGDFGKWLSEHDYQMPDNFFSDANVNEAAATTNANVTNAANAATNDETYETAVVSHDTWLPPISTDWYVYMDVDSITDDTSKQYRLKSEYWILDGICCHNSDYVVAMGSGYAEVGDRFEIETDTGNEYTVFVGELKSDSDTDQTTHTYSPVYIDGELKYANIIEFLVETDKLDEKVKKTGNLRGKYFLNGNITRLTKISQ